MYSKKKIIVVGGGFAGVTLIKRLPQEYFDVLLIDKINHHQFQPLFYQVATSQVEPSSISFPLRHIFKNRSHVQIRLAEVLTVDTTNDKVVTSIGDFEYDLLVIAIGCSTNFFGNNNIYERSLTLKSTYDAIQIRNHILQTFEDILSAGETDKKSLMNMVIVGGGPTGVELAGAFAEIKKNILPKDYHGIDFSSFSIMLIEGSMHTLNSMSDNARTASKKYLEELGVQVLTETIVENYDGLTLSLKGGGIILTKTVIWVAGVTGNKIGGLPAQAEIPNNRIKVDRLNRVAGTKNIFALGDIAYMQTPKYPKAHPQVANVAIGQAKNLARNLKKEATGRKMTEYEYKDLGSMATVGTNKAVVDLPWIKFKGYLAWVTWMFLHLMLILTVKNKLIIFIDWAWAYVAKDTTLRLILTAGRKKKSVHSNGSNEKETEKLRRIF